MKIIISEDRIYDLVIKYLNSMFDVDNINSTNGTDGWGNEVDYAIQFYTGDFDEYDDETTLFRWYGEETTLFRWYGEDYWESDERSGWGDEDDETIKEKKLNSPILIFEDDDKKNQLDNLFGDRWHQPFKDWFQNNFNLPIKTIE
jgi:hypothetical protein